MTPVRVHAIPLAGEVSATQLLLRLGARARRLGIPEPAALIGDWFDSTAVLVPSVTAADRRTDRLSPWRTQPAAGIGPPGAIGGGWIGFLGYPAARRELDSVPAAWGWADHLLRRDRVGQWWFESLSRGRDADPAQASLAAGYAELLAELDAQPRSWWASSMRRPAAETHREAVRGAMAAITAGEVFQTNVCTRFTGRFCGDALALFAAGAAELTPARAAYLTGTWGALASFSPELFLARSGDSLRSMPIKGTLPRRGAADAGNAALLRSSTKDVAENIMITDLMRNDFGRICVPGSVRVPELLRVRPAPGVWHLASTVTGTLVEGSTDEAVLRATFPPGSVTGAPKLRACELIAELEHYRREAYCGAIGLFSPAAGFELSVAIRTLELRGDRVRLGVGGGITAGSDPELEWQECLHKAAPLERLLGSGRGCAGIDRDRPYG